VNRALNFTLLSSVFLLSSGCSRSNVSAGGAPGGMPPVAVRTVAAQAADVPLEIAAIGNVEAISTVDVKARVTAPILRVAFTEGQDVQKGQLLFELDPETYNRQISELEANIARDVANERQSEANIAKDRATLKNAQSIAERGTQLAKEGIFSREQNDQVVSNAAAAKASLEADQAALESARAAENADRAKLEQTKLQLSYTKIYAPISGRAGAVQVKQGNLANENDTTLVTLLQMSPIYVAFSVPENLLSQVQRFNGAHPLQVTATPSDAPPSVGTLRFIDNTVDAATGTIKLKAEFPNMQRSLWPGKFVNVRARLHIEQNRILVPSRTVQTGPEGKYVWVMTKDSKANMRPVEVLRNYTEPGATAEKAVIGSGLTPGEMVISEGQLRLAPGATVRVLQPNQSSSSPGV
jgi:multidrug efflux system membrane fusion protein